MSKYHIPEEYKEFQRLFKIEPNQKTLSKHQSWDYEIKIEDGKILMKKGIYSLSAEKLDALRKYLEENQQKGFIQESQSLAGYLILFVLKKDRSLRLYIDY